MDENGGQAIIEDGAIVIRVSLDALPIMLIRLSHTNAEAH